VVARWAHNPKVVRSSRASATKEKAVSIRNSLFYLKKSVARWTHIRQMADVRLSLASASGDKLVSDLDSLFYFKKTLARCAHIRQLADVRSSRASATEEKEFHLKSVFFLFCIR
jgi:hypothetical protein